MMLIKIKLLSLLLLVGIVFTHCQPQEEPVSEFKFGEGQFSSNGPGAIDTKIAFKNTVYTLTRKHCVNCHTSQVPQHASSNLEHAMSELVDNFKVNFDNIPASRIVAKIKDENHGCWSDCTDDALEMQVMVEEWHKAIEAAKASNTEEDLNTNDEVPKEELKEVHGGSTNAVVILEVDHEAGEFTVLRRQL